MNHRDLVLASPKKPKFLFLTLPHALQDRIIDGLDSNRLTLDEASNMAFNHGFTISHEAISGYCKAVREQRRALLQKTSQGG